MDTQGPQTNEAVQYSLTYALAASGGTLAAMFVAMVTLSYPGVALGAVLGGLAMATGRRARRWFGGLRRRLGRYTASGSGGVVPDEDRSYNTTAR